MNTDHEHVLQSGRLALRLAWRDDRFAHQILWIDGNAHDRTVVLESIEGAPTERWPASPPFQSLDIQGPSGERFVALLVGMAGNGHWSASVESDPLGECLRFDVAYRGHAEQGRALGSQYYRHRRISVDRSPKAAAKGRSGASRLLLRVNHEIAPARFLLSGDTVSIVPQPQPAADRAATIRWAYTVRVTPA